MPDLDIPHDVLEAAAERANQEHRSLVREVIPALLRDYADGKTWLNLPEPEPEREVSAPGRRFTGSDGAERIKTPYGFNAYVNQEDARHAAVRIGRPGTTWYIWRLADGSYDHSAVPDPATPGHPAELVETFTIGGYGKRKRAVTGD